jgi:hypothetical protein
MCAENEQRVRLTVCSHAGAAAAVGGGRGGGGGMEERAVDDDRARVARPAAVASQPTLLQGSGAAAE